MCGSGQKCGHPDLWLCELADSRGVETDLQMWREAELFLDHLCNLYEGHHNEGVVMALADAYNRCIEERRRFNDLARLHKVWASRGVGGVHEPPSAVND